MEAISCTGINSVYKYNLGFVTSKRYPMLLPALKLDVHFPKELNINIVGFVPRYVGHWKIPFDMLWRKKQVEFKCLAKIEYLGKHVLSIKQVYLFSYVPILQGLWMVRIIVVGFLVRTNWTLIVMASEICVITVCSLQTDIRYNNTKLYTNHALS